MTVLFANLAKSELAAGIGTGDTTITVQTGDGAKFPAPTGVEWFPVVLQRKSNYNDVEIARATARSADTITITRAQEGTAALTFVAGDIVDLRLTAAAIAAIDADKLDGQEGSFYRNASNLNAGILPAARFNDTSHGNRGGGSLHAAATVSAAGFMSASDKTKLDGIEAGAEVNVGTNLGQSLAATTVTVTSSTGTNVQIAGAGGGNAGVMTNADKTKLDGIEAGAEVNVGTNLGRSLAVSSVTVTSSTGTNTTIPAATGSVAGVMSSADKTKLDGIEAGAEVNVGTNLGQNRNATSYTVTSSTGNNTTLLAVNTTNAGVMTAADKTKLDSIETGAQVNVAHNLGQTLAASTVTVTITNGNNTVLPAATASLAGVLSAADKVKINALGSMANRDVTISTADPSGGVDGDIWLKYIP